jgi:surface protein
MSNKNGWGDGASNNKIGWGQGANNYIGWGSSELVSYEGLTNIVGAFTTEWTTTANAEQITLPYGVGLYTGTIDWGDGNTDVNDGSVTSHTYATAGTYTVIITGDCTGWYFGNYGGSTYITSVVNWGQLQLGTENGGYNFAFCPNLDLSSVQGTLNLTGVTVFAGLFYDCTSLTTINNINSWDTSAITNMVEMFIGCTAFNQALSFNTSAVTTMNGMFAYCPVFNQSLSFNTSAVTNMVAMFIGCTAFNQALTFNTSAVTDMNSMFNNATAFNQPLTFDTSAVTDMSRMFIGCTAFNQPLTFDTSAVTTMNDMFNGCSAFNQNISSWNTGAVTEMSQMFKDAPAFNQNIGTWDVANVANFTDFMAGKTDATFSTTNLNAIYNGWSASGVQPNCSINFGTAEYTTAGGQAGKDILEGAPNNWTIIDGGGI